MAVAWQAVRARLASALPAVVGASVTVYDGPVVTGDAPTSYLTIADQPSVNGDTVGSFDPGPPQDGYSATENGTVLCELGAVTGDTAVPSVFATFDAITTHLQSDQTLGGVLQPGSTVTASAEVVQEQSHSGARQRLLISISYFTRLP